jgi:hypothetical protein
MVIVFYPFKCNSALNCASQLNVIEMNNINDLIHQSA